MKLLFIRSTGGVSGAETHNLSLLSALQAYTKIDVSLLTNHGLFAWRAKKAGIPTEEIFMPIPEIGTKKDMLSVAFWFFYMVIAYLLKIKSMEKGIPFDTVILQSMTEKLFLSPYLKLAGYRVVWLEHGPLFRTNRAAFVKKAYVYKSKWASTIIAVSEDTKKDLIGGGIRKENIRVVHIGISLSKSKRNLKKKKKQITIGFVGSITKEKGFIDFGSIALQLLSLHKNLAFLVVGEGPLLPLAMKRVEDLGVASRFTFTGYVSDVSPYWHTMDVLLFPTHHEEGLSMALLEALKEGVMVVARDKGGNRELIIDGKTGYLFQTNEEARAVLHAIVSRKKSGKKFAENSKQLLEKQFSPKNQAAQFVESVSFK